MNVSGCEHGLDVKGFGKMKANMSDDASEDERRRSKERNKHMSVSFVSRCSMFHTTNAGQQ